MERLFFVAFLGGPLNQSSLRHVGDACWYEV